MVEIQIDYQGQLRCLATHGPSGTTLNSDAPRDNMGKGESFSPTDMVATALGTCMLTTMGIVARRNNIAFESAAAKVGKEMTSAPTRRIAKLTVEITVPAELSEEDRLRLRNAAVTCPVRKSISEEIQVPLTFYWGREHRAEQVE